VTKNKASAPRAGAAYFHERRATTGHLRDSPAWTVRTKIKFQESSKDEENNRLQQRVQPTFPPRHTHTHTYIYIYIYIWIAQEESKPLQLLRETTCSSRWRWGTFWGSPFGSFCWDHSSSQSHSPFPTSAPPICGSTSNAWVVFKPDVLSVLSSPRCWHSATFSSVHTAGGFYFLRPEKCGGEALFCIVLE